MRFDVRADIIPGQSIGGVSLRTPLLEFHDDLMDYSVRRLDSPFYELVSIYEARYKVADGAIMICADVRNGKIFKVCALEGYRGKLSGRLGVGMRVSDAMAREPRLYYNESEEVLLIDGVDGVSLDVPVVDPFPEEVPGMCISAISVEIPELLTLAVQRGTW
jgi:hypothetical protein